MTVEPIQPGQIPPETLFLRPANRRFAEGKARRMASPYAINHHINVVLCLFYALFGAVEVMSEINAVNAAAAFAKSSVTINATVKSTRSATSSCGRNGLSRCTNYYVTYEYFVGDYRLTREAAPIDKSTFDLLQKGSTVAIRYLPENPADSHLVSGEETSSQWIFIGLAGAGTLGFGWYWLWKVRQVKLLRRDGKLYKGYITDFRVDRRLILGIFQVEGEIWGQVQAEIPAANGTPQTLMTGRTLSRRWYKKNIDQLIIPRENVGNVIILYVNEKLYEIL